MSETNKYNILLAVHDMGIWPSRTPMFSRHPDPQPIRIVYETIARMICIHYDVCVLHLQLDCCRFSYTWIIYYTHGLHNYLYNIRLVGCVHCIYANQSYTYTIHSVFASDILLDGPFRYETITTSTQIVDACVNIYEFI